MEIGSCKETTTSSVDKESTSSIPDVMIGFENSETSTESRTSKGTASDETLRRRFLKYVSKGSNGMNNKINNKFMYQNNEDKIILKNISIFIQESQIVIWSITN